MKKFLKMIRDYHAARQPRLVGQMAYEVTGSNMITGFTTEYEEYAYFFQTPRGKRTVSVTDPGLKKQPAIVTYLQTGVLPNGARVS